MIEDRKNFIDFLRENKYSEFILSRCFHFDKMRG